MFQHPRDVPEICNFQAEFNLNKKNSTSTEKNLEGTTAVHRGNNQSCGQLSNKYTDLFCSATEKQKLLHVSKSKQQK